MLAASLIAVASLLVGQAAAHGGVTSYIIDGTTYPGWQAFNTPTGQKSIGRPYSSYNPILTTSDATFACNNNGQASSGQLNAPVKPGSTITAKWGQWTHAEGPVIVYMAKCPGACSSANSGQLDWFKISELGLISGTLAKGSWGNGQIMAKLAYDVKIPNLPDGEYMIRHELLALHQANTPQFYPECAQLTLTGGSGSLPGTGYTVKFPGGYTMSDPGVLVDIYSASAPSITTYKVPGPAVWNGAAAAPQPTSQTQPATTVTTSTTVVAPQPTVPAGPTVPPYGQCGGIGYTGATQCASGTCTKVNDYYSQCL
ncbi:glycosyl hydrolase family 61-domain-containing protein [Ephemerocybe angulata]|uniref:AA9 family lytic polysaccharide monooxygenase n=1 Tax=Ephemerocybe angulata TaxID=980116 RepID=A0A8H6LZ02_9AGAR|nr:glycosyl hydrolase family 61-domain-containing protein [Tulosesus angulatus]